MMDATDIQERLLGGILRNVGLVEVLGGLGSARRTFPGS